MALSGVRSSWLILARNCDLCWLASSSCRLLSWISSNSRTFSMAITAWSAKVVASSICLSVNGRTVIRFLPLGVARRAWCDTRSVAKVHIRDRPECRECERFCLQAAFALRTILGQARSKDSANIPYSLASLGTQRPSCTSCHWAARCSRFALHISELPTPPAYREPPADQTPSG